MARTTKQSLLERVNTSISLLNRMGTSFKPYDATKTIKELEYIYLNATQAYQHKIILSLEQLETPLYVNEQLSKQ